MSTTLDDLRSDILLILSKSKLSKDFRIRFRHIEFLIAKYRARGIREEYKRNNQIDPQWLQDFGRVQFTPVTSADDPAIVSTSITLGKYSIPTVVSLPNDKGVFKVRGTSKQQDFFYEYPGRFFQLIQSGSEGHMVRGKFNYYTRQGNVIYTYPCIDEGNIALILDNPLDGYVISSENILSGSLIIGIIYKVISGQVVHNSIPYGPGSIFTAVNTNFLGTGIVQFNNQKRNMLSSDPYPISLTLSEYISLKILTQEFKLEPQQISDIKVDSSDQSTILQNQNE